MSAVHGARANSGANAPVYGAFANSGANAKPRFGPALFLAMFAFLWVTTNPYVDLVQLQAGGGFGPGGSNAVNQAAAILLTLLMAAFGLHHPMRAQICQPRWLLGATLGWFLFSSLLSNFPADAAKRTILAAMTCLNAGVFLLLARSERQFAKLLAAGVALTLLFAYFGVMFLPRLAIHQPDEPIEPINAGYWRGHYPHKNEAAAVMLIAAFFGLYLGGVGMRVVGLVFTALSLFFLAHTGGKSSTAMLPAILCLQWLFERMRWLRLPIAVGGIAVFNLIALGASQSEDFRALIKSFGVDPTFTNRTDIWKIAFDAIGDAPVLGFGFQGFWRTSDITNSARGLETWAVKAYNSHNAYLDTLVTTGVPGLLLVIGLIFVVPLRAIARLDRLGNDPALSRLFMRIWLYGIYSACLEVNFFQSGSPLWFIMLVAIFGLDMQANARLIGDCSKTTQRHGSRNV